MVLSEEIIIWVLLTIIVPQLINIKKLQEIVQIFYNN